MTSLRKPDSLRDWLQRCVPAFKDHPDTLFLSVKDGRIGHKLGSSLTYRWSYTLEIQITNWAQGLELIQVPLIAWLQQHQPDIFATDNGLRIDQDILDATTCDLEINLDLSEVCQITALAGDGWSATWLPEPDYRDRFPGLDPPALLRLIEGALHPDGQARGAHDRLAPIAQTGQP